MKVGGWTLTLSSSGGVDGSWSVSLDFVPVAHCSQAGGSSVLDILHRALEKDQVPLELLDNGVGFSSLVS